MRVLAAGSTPWSGRLRARRLDPSDPPVKFEKREFAKSATRRDERKAKHLKKTTLVQVDRAEDTEAMTADNDTRITQISGRGMPLLLDDIDTDRIIPARFLRCVTFDGLGEHAFEDDRQQDPQHPYNNAAYQGARVLVVGRNFGCGSSREHAPQALMRSGIAAIIGESFAEIFFGNCVGLGIPCVTVPRAVLEHLDTAIKESPATEITVHLAEGYVAAAGLRSDLQMPASARQSLVTGQWDFLSQLLEGKPQIATTITKVPYLQQFRV